MIGFPLASVLILAIVAFSITAISITALVIGYLERRDTFRLRSRSKELQYRQQTGGSRPQEPGTGT